jgi:hypothetical protein
MEVTEAILTFTVLGESISVKRKKTESFDFAVLDQPKNVVSTVLFDPKLLSELLNQVASASKKHDAVVRIEITTSSDGKDVAPAYISSMDGSGVHAMVMPCRP